MPVESPAAWVTQLVAANPLVGDAVGADVGAAVGAFSTANVGTGAVPGSEYSPEATSQPVIGTEVSLPGA
jgi:hypothetical protein